MKIRQEKRAVDIKTNVHSLKYLTELILE
jgi:hypothetical protein